MNIRFEKFIIDKKSISFDVVEDENVQNIFFRSSCPLFCDNDRLAYALSTLCGQKYDEIYFDMKLSNACKENIGNFTKSIIFTGDTENLFNFSEKSLIKKDIILNFSGGLDSLAALGLLPKENTALVSVDFGGWFERETDFFELFNPNIISTNFRQKKYDRNSWTFMGIGAILLSGYYSSKYNVFGSILEASIETLNSKKISDNIAPFKYVYLDEMRVVSGLTEVGTAIVSYHFFGDSIIAKSLRSLAADGSEKHYRKELLIKAAKRFYGQYEFCDSDATMVDEMWGKNFATDFSLIYVLTKCKDKASFSNIPKDVIDLCKEISGDFYEKFNSDMYEYIPIQYRNYVVEHLIDADIKPYSKTDYDELLAVKNIINKYYYSES